MNGIPSWAKSMKTWLVMGTIVFGFYAGAAAIGLQVPRWTWFSEHIALAGEVHQNTIKMYQGDVKSIRRQLIDSRIGLSKVDQDRNPQLYERFLRDADELRAELQDARDSLTRARQRK